MSIGHVFGRMLGLEESQSVVRMSLPSLGASWAHDAPAWVLFGCFGLALLATVFYLRFQPNRDRRTRTILAMCRAAVLVLLGFALAEPYVTLTVATRQRPALCLLFDGTDSMGIIDDLGDAERSRVDAAMEVESGASRSRIDYVKAWIEKKESLLGRLEKDFRLQAYLFDRTSGLRLLELSPSGQRRMDRQHLAAQLTSEGQVTALGAALEELGRRNVTSSLAGVVVVSDFNQNTGPAAVEAARQLGAKVYTVGVGPSAALDLAVDLQVPPVTKKDERATLAVTLHHQGAINEPVVVKLGVRPVGDGEPARPIEQRSVRLADAIQTVEFPYTPDRVGQFEIIAEAEPLPGEVVRENNRVVREVSVRDDFIRLLFVEYEPTWEWRFIKEVFHRDKLVGQRGFRTFLRSADPKVRKTNELFLPTMAPSRSEFFAYDVILLGDLPAGNLSLRFCQMAEEFVNDFGGGLVVLAGPRFGPGQLAETPLAKMLPVVVDPAARIRQREAFTLQLRPEAGQTDFMQLGSGPSENARAWANLGPLPWYQPVDRLHPMAITLAEHPSDTCADGKTRQPLVAMRRYGHGEVVYLGFDETWRMRRKYGEQYFRQFWGQMIHRLALSHALGVQKRFVVRTDRRQYQADDSVILSVDAYDTDFQPLADDAVSGGALRGELVLPEDAARDATARVQPVSVPLVRKGRFETRFPVFAGGEYRVRIKDPLGDQHAETSFHVANLSVERQRAVRNAALEQAIAEATGGKSCDLVTADRIADEIRLNPKIEVHEQSLALWNTRLMFVAVVMLLLTEWVTRKRVNLP